MSLKANLVTIPIKSFPGGKIIARQLPKILKPLECKPPCYQFLLKDAPSEAINNFRIARAILESRNSYDGHF